VIREVFVVLNHKVAEQQIDYLVDKMQALVTCELSRTTKSSNDILKNELGYIISGVVLDKRKLYPMCQIMHCGSDVPNM